MMGPLYMHWPFQRHSKESLSDTMGFAAGAMTILDTEPLDSVNYANGVFGYIILVHSIDLLSYEHVALTGFIGNLNITDPERV